MKLWLGEGGAWEERYAVEKLLISKQTLPNTDSGNISTYPGRGLSQGAIVF